MKLTEKEALEKCIEMWSWLSKHPEADKDDYFIAMNINKNNIPDAGCYCCEYAINDQGRKDCKRCPVWKGAKYAYHGCYHPSSPYYFWVEDDENRIEYAQMIVELAVRALNKLNKEKVIMRKFEFINSIDDAAEAIKYFYKIYNIDNDVSTIDIYSDFVNFRDYKEYLDSLPYNKLTKPLFEYVFCFSLDDTETKYMKMIFDEDIGTEIMLAEMIADAEIDKEWIDGANKKTKFTLYDSIMFGKKQYWYGVDKGLKDIDLRRSYEKYKLQWMIDHEYTLTDIISQLDNLHEDDPDATITDLVYQWEKDFGFAQGEIWACYDEWLNNEAAESGLV